MTDSTGGVPGAGVVRLDIAERNAGQRIDNFLLTLLKGVPRSRIYRLLRKGEVRINNKRVRPEYRLCVGDQLRLPPVRTAAAAAPARISPALRADLTGRVLARGQGWMVVDKPAGIAVHGGSGQALGMVEAARQIWPGVDLDLVHRLDRETSGCLLLATGRAALSALQAQMRAGSMGKRYQVLVVGRWPRDLQPGNAHAGKLVEKFGSAIDIGPHVQQTDVLSRRRRRQIAPDGHLPGRPGQQCADRRPGDARQHPDHRHAHRHQAAGLTPSHAGAGTAIRDGFQGAPQGGLALVPQGLGGALTRIEPLPAVDDAQPLAERGKLGFGQFIRIPVQQNPDVGVPVQECSHRGYRDGRAAIPAHRIYGDDQGDCPEARSEGRRRRGLSRCRPRSPCGRDRSHHESRGGDGGFRH